MEFISDIILEVNSNTAYTVVGAKQGDNDTRVVQAHLVQDGGIYEIEDGATATFRFRKPDGKAVINTATILDRTQGIVAVGLTSQALAVAGRGYGDIVLTKNRQILSTVSFIVVIMSAPQVVTEIVSSNEFGYIEDIVASSRDTIYEAEAWAKGTRAGVPVANIDYLAAPEFYSPLHVIAGVELDEEIFKNAVGSNRGAQREFKFTYKNTDGINGYWSLVITTTTGGTSTVSEAERYDNLTGFGITVIYAGSNKPNNNDYITVSIIESDITYQANAKYYADLAAASQQAVEDLEVTAEKVYADEFGPYEEYAVNDYVWYTDPTTNQTLLYRFITAHQPGPWNYEEVTEKSLIDKSTDLQEQVTSLHLHLPQGKTGDVNFMTFEIDTDPISETNGELLMYKPRKGVEEVNFQILDRLNPIGQAYEGYLAFSLGTGGGT